MALRPRPVNAGRQVAAWLAGTALAWLCTTAVAGPSEPASRLETTTSTTSTTPNRQLPPDLPGSFEDRVDQLVRDSFEHPARALLALDLLRRDTSPSAASTRVLLQAAGSIEARAGNAVRAAALAEQLLAGAADAPDGRRVAASNLVRALVAETAGQLDVAAALAQSALPAFQAGCPGAAPAAVACDYRSAWRALNILERRALSLGGDGDRHGPCAGRARAGRVGRRYLPRVPQPGGTRRRGATAR